MSIEQLKCGDLVIITAKGNGMRSSIVDYGTPVILLYKHAPERVHAS